MVRKFRNKKGWIRIVEAFIAILLIAGVVLTITMGEFIQREDDSEIYNAQLGILRDIQVNDVLRQAILEAPNVDSDDNSFPGDVETKIETLTPVNLECKAKICAIDAECGMNLDKEEIFVQSVAIIATSTTYNNPKQLKLFCWRK